MPGTCDKASQREDGKFQSFSCSYSQHFDLWALEINLCAGHKDSWYSLTGQICGHRLTSLVSRTQHSTRPSAQMKMVMGLLNKVDQQLHLFEAVSYPAYGWLRALVDIEMLHWFGVQRPASEIRLGGSANFAGATIVGMQHPRAALKVQIAVDIAPQETATTVGLVRV